MTRLLTLACVAVLALDGVGAPIRQPAGRGEADELPDIAVTRITKGKGAVFGHWHIWGLEVGPLAGVEDGGPAIVLINQSNGAVLYLPWTSNGWINHRDGDGKWYVSFNTGPSRPQDRADLHVEQFNGRRPDHRLVAGQHEIDLPQKSPNRVRAGWEVKVTSDVIEFNLPGGRSRITVRRNGADVTFNNRTIGAATKHDKATMGEKK